MTGLEIKELRMELKMTQQQLADSLGVHRVTVAEWERNHKRPSNLAKRQLSRLNAKSKNPPAKVDSVEATTSGGSDS